MTISASSSKERKRLMAILRELEINHQKMINKIWDKYLEQEEKEEKGDSASRD